MAKRTKSKPRIDLAQQTRQSLEFHTVLALFACNAQTERGKAMVRDLDLLDETHQAAHFTELDAWYQYLGDRTAPRFPAIPKTSDFARNPRVDPFTAAELRVHRDMLLFWERVLSEDDLAFARGAEERDPELDSLTRELNGLFEPDGSWREDVSPKYSGLIRQWVTIDQQLDQQLKGLVRRYGDYLNESIIFERNHRRVLAVKLNFRGRVKGILQDYSSSGNTIYVEPEETTDKQYRLVQIEAEIEEELWRIRVEKTEALLSFTSLPQRIYPLITRMDMMQALAATGKEAKLISLTPNHDQRLELYNARHPFLDEHFARLRKKSAGAEETDKNQMVPFSLSLDADSRGLIISGANTGGKTVTLKTTGLVSWMANSGLPTPLDEGSHVPFYRVIFADIGDNQSLSHNLSTFASHLANMRAILEADTPETLVLLDELGSGTDPREGNALAQALIEEILVRRFHLLVTTHQQVLCTYALTHDHLDNASMAFDSRRLQPTYRFTQGVPGRSHALEIAANSGLPKHVLDQAQQLIDDNQVDIQAAILALQQQHKELRKQQGKLRRDELRLHRKIQETREETRKYQRMQEDFKEKSRIKLSKTVEKAERELRTVLQDVATQKQRRSGVTKFAAARNELMQPYKEPEKLDEVEAELQDVSVKEWKAGDQLFLKTWRKEVKLIDVDRKRARVDFSGKVLTVAVSDLAYMKQPKLPEKGRVNDHVETGSDEVLSVELKLLGFRVDDAMLELDRAIDTALRRNIPFLKVIHGHGSGALKNALRSYLKRHQSKSDFSVHIDVENDGITELKFA